MTAAISVGAIFVYLLVGNSIDYRVLQHRKDPSRPIHRWDLWFHPEVFTDEGQRLRQIGAWYYVIGGLVVVAILVLRPLLHR
jgi:hypothetical protein